MLRQHFVRLGLCALLAMPSLLAAQTSWVTTTGMPVIADTTGLQSTAIATPRIAVLADAGLKLRVAALIRCHPQEGEALVSIAEPQHLTILAVCTPEACGSVMTTHAVLMPSVALTPLTAEKE